MIDTSLDLALAFLQAHPTWYIFPIQRLEKFPPLITDNLSAASNDPKQIRKWHDKWRGCNWGLALRKSGVIVMDADLKPGKIGQQTLDNLVIEFGELPPTLTARTPSGGLHYYFNGVHRFALGKYGFGIDIDSPNYVLIPGCWLCSNSEQGYEEIDSSPVADAPEWFGEFLKEKAEKVSPDAEPAVDADKAPNVERMRLYLQEGAPPSIMGQGGEKVLFDVACVLKDNGISYYGAVELLNKYYNVPGKCEPQWASGEGADADRLDVKVRNAYDYARENVAGSATAEFAFGDPGDVIDKSEVDAMGAAWDRRLSTQNAEKQKTRETKVFTEESNPIDPLTGEPEDDPLTGEPEDDPPPTGGARKPDNAGSADEPGTSDNPKAPAKPDTIAWLAQNWVWVVGVERFVRRSDGLMWSRTQFDSKFNHMATGASVSAALFKCKNRIKRIEKIVYRPGQGIFLENGAAFNLWRDSPIVPKEGNTDLWNEHLNYLFQNPEDKDHVLNWMAWVYQNPSRKPNYALLLVGKNTGTGKSFIARVLEQLIGKANTQRPKNSSLKGEFNAWALTCKLCIIEELMQIGRKEVTNLLRDVITEATIEVNIKKISAQLIENYLAMMGISNHPDAMPIDETDRRWLVVSTPVSRLDPAYYDRLFGLLDSPDALAAIAYELKTRKLGTYSATGTAPYTAAKGEMITLSRGDAEAWLHDNAANAPLSHSMLTVADVIDAMPGTLQRTSRLNTTVQNFLRDRLRGEYVGQIRLKDDRRVRLWGLHGQAKRLKNVDPVMLSAMYEKERQSKTGALSPETQAAEDFGD